MKRSKKKYIQKKLTDYTYPYQKLIPYGTSPAKVVSTMDLVWVRKGWKSKIKGKKVHWSVIYKDDLITTKSGKQIAPEKFINLCKKKDSGFMALWEDDMKYVFAWVEK